MPKTTPMQAIKKHCLQCGDGTYKMVEECHIEDCNLYPFRFGMSIESHELKKKRAKKKQLKKREQLK